ncbi:hypothetical protein Leryth_013465 [Lithospermum erythrorhizon]|nr:hypothetical protein Leryth_013465 [Lithospermum erythrorhizon]
MEFSGEDKEIRMSGNLGYNPLENLDQQPLLGPQQEDKTPQQNSHQAEKFSGLSHVGGGATSAVALNSSIFIKPIKPPVATTNTASASRSMYRECLKNHAANKGGNVTDGCGEFMPCGEEGTMEALKCAACSCHRNFHRREMHHVGENNNALVLHHHHHLQLPPSLTSLSLNHRKPAAIPDGGGHQWPVQMAAAFTGGGGGGSGSVATDSSSEELNFKAYQSSPDVGPLPPYVLSKKRFRTKFTQEQKEKMLEFAEKLGWRIPREDDSEVQRFCAEVGVKRHVFKVWMHNNKSSSSSSSSSKKNNPQEPLNIMSSS